MVFLNERSECSNNSVEHMQTSIHPNLHNIKLYNDMNLYKDH